MRDPVPVAPNKGARFEVRGVVIEVEGEKVKLRVEKEGRPLTGRGTWQKELTLRLGEMIQAPRVEGRYVFKGVVSGSFTKYIEKMDFKVDVQKLLQEAPATPAPAETPTSPASPEIPTAPAETPTDPADTHITLTPGETSTTAAPADTPTAPVPSIAPASSLSTAP
jgi:hypothetical protein